MKKTKMSFFMAFAMVFAILLSAFVAFGISKGSKVKAVDSVPEPERTIYCFTDFYNTYPYYELSETYPDYNIEIDRYVSLTSTDFTAMVQDDYFADFDVNCVVIIDIKTFIPDSATLNTLFFNLKMLQGCMTAFVSIYDYDNGDLPTDFMQYVDSFYYSDCNRLVTFLGEVLANMAYNSSNPTLQNTIFLIDNNLAQTTLSDINNQSIVSALCSDFVFMDVLFEVFATYFSIQTDNKSLMYESLTYIFNFNNIKILLYVNASTFVDVVSGSILNNTTYSFLKYLGNGAGTNYVCAIGFSYIETEFYDFLLAGQNAGNLPVYLLEVEHIIYNGTSGLSIITDSDLNEERGYIPLEVEEAMEILTTELIP